MRIGLIVNPIAGMGGRVGLKGTDGEETLKEAMARGAEPTAPRRASEALSGLVGVRDEIEWLTWSGEMGEGPLRSVGLTCEVVGRAEGDRTTAEDTKEAARRMEELGVDLILFAGGDGTASDIVEAVDMRVPILGIPAGVKMFSAVFASTPRAASQMVLRLLAGDAQFAEREVMDIDEEAYRAGRLSASLKGYAVTPYTASLILNGKTASPADEELMKEAVAARVVEEMRPGAAYILGPGSTVAKVAEVLGVEKTMLGIDVVRDGRLVVRDADEKALLRVAEGETWIVLSPLGGQGSLLGRGNHPLSPAVLRRVGLDRIIVIATPLKVQRLGALTVDTGDPELDSLLRGYRRVVVGYHEEKVMRVV
ncbi:MAG: ATP-NAD kinase family protein [Candidatus Bathyarchaeia archaeon]